MEIVFVCIGNYQEYILSNIQNLLLFGNNNITVITDKHFFKFFDNINVNLIDCNIFDNEYIKKSNLNKTFRNGFWIYTSYRFFILYEYMKKYNKQNIIHLENDVMCYVNVNKLSFTNDKIYLTFDSPGKVVPGFIYIPKYELLKQFLDNYDFNENDMINFGRIDENISISLPLIDNSINTFYKLNINYNSFNSIFDAAAIGQYLGGIDKQNDPNDTRGYISDTCKVNYSEYKFFWKKENELYCPYMRVNDKFIKINNLHIHCKELYKFMANKPIETKFISILH
jgi:hypothetical protein